MRSHFVYFVVIALSSGASVAHAQTVYPWEIRSLDAAIKHGNTTARKVDCNKNPDAIPKCAEMTDEVCETLWGQKNKGNMKLLDGDIKFGTTGKSEMNLITKANYQASIDSYPRLPEDLKRRAGPVLKELQATLNKEKDATEWYRAMSRATTKWNDIMEDVAEERVFKAHPELKKIPSKDLTVEQKAIIKRESIKLDDEYLEAKYKTHKNWKRVEKVFDQVQKDMIEEINGMKVSPERKQAMLKIVSGIKLKLPYADPNKISQSAGCGSVKKNAFYSPSTHAFTVCAGLFNGLESESALYAVVAHEIGHSIDPQAMALRDMKENDPLERSLKKLTQGGSDRMSCEEWGKLTSGLEKSPQPKFANRKDEMQSLYDCLAPKKGLSEYVDDVGKQTALRTANTVVSNYATDNSFSTFAQPTILKNGVKTDNPFFLRKDRLRASDNGNVFLQQEDRAADTLDIFDQALKCEVEQIDGKSITYSNATAEQRAKPFDRAIDKTTAIIAARKMNWFSYCGTNCGDLTDSKMSANSDENFADWIAAKTLNRHLLRKPQLRDRREAAASAFASFCEDASAQSDAPDLTSIEKSYSLESHNDNRIRRLSIFNEANKQAVQCKADGKDQGLGACEL